MGKIKTLFFAADPGPDNTLRLGEEIREITHKMRLAEHRDSLELVSALAAQPDDLLQMLNQHRPGIVHFSAHGKPTGEILIQDKFGLAHALTPGAIGALFGTMKDDIRVVVLSACYSRVQAEAIVQHIDCVIGMNTAISVEAGILFAASFYRAIGFDRPVKQAFEQGLRALELKNIPESHIPELLVKKGVDPAKIFPLGGIPAGPKDPPTQTFKIEKIEVFNNNFGTRTPEKEADYENNRN